MYPAGTRLTFLNFLPCFELLCNISYYMSHKVDSTATIGWTLVLWGTNACKCGQFDCENEHWVGNKCFACVLSLLLCVYQLYLHIYIYISYPTNVVILLFKICFFIRYLTCQYGARHNCPLSKSHQQQTKPINVQELC